MARILRALAGNKPRPTPAPRSAPEAGAGQRPHLALVRPVSYPPLPIHYGLWQQHALPDSIALTTLEDWPSEEEFEPLIAGARAAGDHVLAALLEHDRAICAEARARFRTQHTLSHDSSA